MEEGGKKKREFEVVCVYTRTFVHTCVCVAAVVEGVRH